MQNITEIKLLANKIRRDVIQMIGCEGQTGHLGGSCSSAEILATLYGSRLRFRPDDPKWEGRDKFLYSKGHAELPNMRLWLKWVIFLKKNCGR